MSLLIEVSAGVPFCLHTLCYMVQALVPYKRHEMIVKKMLIMQTYIAIESFSSFFP